MPTVTQKLNYRVDKDFIKNYDELININLVRQPSDIGFTDYDKLMIRPRKPFLFESLPPAVTGNSSPIFFSTNINRITRAYRVVNTTANGTRSWVVQYATVTNVAYPSTGLGAWTDCTNPNIGSHLVNDYTFSTVSIPTNFNQTESNIFPIPTQATIVDRVRRAVPADTEGATAIGKIMLIYTGIYKGVYAPIVGYDSITDEYIIEGSGAIVPFRALDSYAIYDTLANNVQLLSRSTPDYYIDGILRRSLIDFTNTSLRQSKVIGPSEFIGEQVSFNNARYVFKGGTIFPSRGVPGNPFFYTLTGQLTVASQEIIGAYVYRNRLICYGKSFIYAVRTDGTIEKITDNFGIIKNAIVSTGDDLMFISTDRKIVSINESIQGSLYTKDIADSLFNYTRDFTGDCWAGADTENIYFGGRKFSFTITDRPYIIVYNLVYKFWSVYTGPQILSCVSYNGTAFFQDAFVPAFRIIGGGVSNEYFGLLEDYPSSTNQNTVTTFVQQSYEQKVSTRWIDLGRIFEIKSLSIVKLWFENLRTRCDTIVFMLLDGKVGSKTKQTHSIDGVTTASYLGINVTGQELLGGSSVPIDSYFPRIITETHTPDRALSWKYVLQSVGEDGFYLNGMQITMNRETTEEDYNNPQNGR